MKQHRIDSNNEKQSISNTFPQFTIVNDGKKIGRNETCPCGSNKKYKRCCMDKDKLEAELQSLYSYRRF